MNHVERVRSIVSVQNVDPLPREEWTMWWEGRMDHWHGEGLTSGMGDSDQLELLHRIHWDLHDFNLQLLEQISKIGNPVLN